MEAQRTSDHSASTDFDYTQYDALGLAECVANSIISSEALLEQAIIRATQVNPAINAIVTPLYDFGRQQLANGLPNGPFTGVPFLVKDLICGFTGTPLSNGSQALKRYISPQDTELAKRFKQAGVVMFGKTNTPELGLMGITEPEAFGPCRNPWDLSRTPGGSSGGSAAAIAAGIVPMASGGDGGGSIRIPASCCGLFGFKPSRGLVPTGPYANEFWDGAANEHVITRSVRDSATMLDATAGIDGSSPYPVSPSGYAAALTTPVRKLRIGYTCRSFYNGKVDAAALKAVAHTVVLLRDLGHEVEEIDLSISADALLESYMTMYLGHVATDVDLLAEALNQPIKKLAIEESTRVLAGLGNMISAKQFVKAKRQWNQFSRLMHDFHQQYDMLLTPTVAKEPIEVGSLAPPLWQSIGMKLVNQVSLHNILFKSGVVQQMFLDNLAPTPFTQLANFTGQPAMSVPLYLSEKGLPMGSQFVAPMGQDSLLLQLAHQLEQAQPWFGQRPSLFP